MKVSDETREVSAIVLSGRKEPVVSSMRNGRKKNPQTLQSVLIGNSNEMAQESSQVLAGEATVVDNIFPLYRFVKPDLVSSSYSHSVLC
ncbi:hypothetical protein ElyMa_001753600 [Elysia marginata]|uniref:Uncharacterized protein n=1 Tax=Elysia marginata TaxID=1093978 RepID=A0AAV4E9U4_9GAST|nr:hypothetical protein ElyMa_001753600 [Elysia marginata]